ncbi:MAG TPA: hypothetical protein VNJ29_01995, partial [Candidatus Nitrosotenuis sp.]|nr:hypothetical protein [Candidatus Nitrosotenuis sp.]
APIGTNLIVNLLLYVFVFSSRNWLLSQPFIMVYGVFIILAGLDQCLYWLIIKLFLPSPFPLRHVVLSVVMIGLIFPAFSLLSLRWQQKLEN